MAKKKRKTPEKKKEEVKEYFEIENKEGEEKIIEKKGEVEEEIVGKGQIKSENNLLLWIIGICVFILAAFLAGYFYYMSTQNFEVNGVEYDIVDGGDVLFYHTEFPLIRDGKKIDYNVYIRNDPRVLVEEVPFDGLLSLRRMAVVNISDEKFNCDGRGIIAIANMVQVFEGIGMTAIKDPEATCDESGRYMYINIQEGEETKVTKYGPSCYQIEVNNCEILEGTERMIIKTVELASSEFSFL